MKLNVLQRRLFPYRWLIIGFVGVIGFIGVSLLLAKASAPWIVRLRNSVDEKIRAMKILRDPSIALKTSEGRTNILILGKGGANHEAPDLTDTIMVVSVRLADRRVDTISVPRDIWIDSMKAKINSAYYYGEQKLTGGGVVLARDAVFQVTDLPIHYSLLVDFEGFKRAIDLVGGVDVEVERGFTDEKYPVEGLNGQIDKLTNGQIDETSKPLNTPDSPKNDNAIYETVRFEKGPQHMDGELALKFARSRNSTDPEEGTDFARARRQQKILVAFSEKLKAKETVLNLERIKELERIFRQYVQSDVGDEALLALGRIGVKINPSAVQTIGLDAQNGDGLSFLVNPPVRKYGQWVLEPRTGSWEEIHEYIDEKLK